MSEMVLDDADLVAITKRTRKSAQSRVLTALGIEHKRRPDGSIFVLWPSVENAYANKPAARAKKAAPDFSMVR